jgi:DNA polymerase-3 subunit epsilon
VSTCPCAGAIDEAAYRDIVDVVVHGLTRDPSVLLDPLGRRMEAMAAAERFEEAADLRVRAAALAGAIYRQRRLDALRRAGRVVVELTGGVAVELDGGRMVRTWTGDVLPLPLDDLRLPLPHRDADEVACIAAWLDKEAHRVRLVSCDGELTSPVAALRRFTPHDPSPATPAATKVLLRARG